MVVAELTEEEVDDLFRALADRTRRDILRRCACSEPSVSRLADAYPMSFAAVQKHVAVMEREGLVTKQRRAREQRVRTNLEADHENLTVSVISRFDAPAERVWELWSDPRQLERWWGRRPPGDVRKIRRGSRRCGTCVNRPARPAACSRGNDAGSLATERW